MTSFIIGTSGVAVETPEHAAQETQKVLDNIFRLAEQRPPQFKLRDRGPTPIIMVQEPTSE